MVVKSGGMACLHTRLYVSNIHISVSTYRVNQGVGKLGPTTGAREAGRVAGPE